MLVTGIAVLSRAMRLSRRLDLIKEFVSAGMNIKNIILVSVLSEPAQMQVTVDPFEVFVELSQPR